MFGYFWGLLTPMLGFWAQHGPNWQMAWQQSFISCICPSHNGAGICLKKGPLKLNIAIFTGKNMAVCQNLVPLVNIKIAGKWMFIPLKMVCIGIDP